MTKRTIAAYTREEFDALRARLEAARDALRREGSLLQSIARGYYVVYALASFLGGTYGVKATHIRAGKRVTDQNFSHTELPAVVYALYTGLKRENVTDPGGSPGIGAGHYDERQAYENAGNLAQLRIEADYGPNTAQEPYTIAQTDMWLIVANDMTQDLESVL